MTRARMEDRASDAAHFRLLHEAGKRSRRTLAIPTVSADIFCWLRQLASRTTGAGA